MNREDTKDRKGKYECGNRESGTIRVIREVQVSDACIAQVSRFRFRFRVMGYVWDATNVVPRLDAKTMLTLAPGWVSKFMDAKVYNNP